MSTARRVPLGELCRFVGGGTPSRKVPEYFNGSIPWATVKDFRAHRIAETLEHISETGLRNSAANLVPAGTVLVVTRVGLGKVAISDVDLAINQDIKALIPKGDLEPEYLLWQLMVLAPQIERMGTGATVKGITLPDLSSIHIAIPPLEEQRRIVDILGHASSIRHLREQAQAKAREIIPALFLNMFGDPATNPKGWRRRTLEELGELDRGKSKHRPRNAQELFGGKYPFIQTGDVANSGGMITIYSQLYSEKGLAQSRMWSAGTLCITIAANIAMTGILTFDACFPDSVVGFKPGEEVTVEYVQCALDLLQPQIEKAAPQLAQKNINLKILRALLFPVPPLADQRRFSDLVADIRATSVLLAQASEMSEGVGTALLNQAFDFRYCGEK